MSFLLLYLSREGQTRRIAEAIASELQQAGAVAVVRELSQVGRTELEQCQRLVVGASIHYGHLPQPLYVFIREHQALLAARDGAFFCVNLTARKPGKDTPQGSPYVRTFLKKSVWQPQRLAVFAGALRYPRYRWFDRLMIRFIMWLTDGPTDPRTDIELTDWDKVRAFARTLLE